MSIFNDFCPDCGLTACACTSPAVQDDNCISPSDVELGEVKSIILDCPDADDWTMPTSPISGYTDSSVDDTANASTIMSWIDAIDNTQAGGIKRIKVIGSIGQPETTKILMPENKNITINRRYTLNFRVPHANQLTRNYFKWIQSCQPALFMWYQTLGNGFYGGENGIRISEIDVWEQKDEGAQSAKFWAGTIIFDALCVEDRDYVPEVAAA